MESEAKKIATPTSGVRWKGYIAHATFVDLLLLSLPEGNAIRQAGVPLLRPRVYRGDAHQQLHRRDLKEFVNYSHFGHFQTRLRQDCEEESSGDKTPK